MRHRMVELQDEDPKTPEQWAELSELHRTVRTAYAGAQVFATLALHAAVLDLTAAVERREP